MGGGSIVEMASMNDEEANCLKPLVELIFLRLSNSISPSFSQSFVKKVIVTGDFPSTMEELSELNGHPITYTNDEYAHCVAKVEPVKIEGSTGVVIVLNKDFSRLLLSESDDDVNAFIHMMHHELGHVYDFETKFRHLADDLARSDYSAKEKYLFGYADRMWSEYFANRYSAATASNQDIARHAQILSNALSLAMDAIDQANREFSHSRNGDVLLDSYQLHAGRIMTSMAYVAGYCDGLSIPLGELIPLLHDNIKAAGLESGWCDFSEALSDMAQTHSEWEGISAFRNLTYKIEEFLSDLGLVLGESDQGIYVKVH